MRFYWKFEKFDENFASLFAIKISFTTIKQTKAKKNKQKDVFFNKEDGDNNDDNVDGDGNYKSWHSWCWWWSSDAERR